MKIILNSMYQKRFPSEIKIDKDAQLEVFLFKYLHFNKKLITQEDFKKACGNSLRGIKFPTEFNCKIKWAYIRCLHSFLAEKKDVRFLDKLRNDYPEYYRATELYLKKFYYGIIRQLVKDYHTKQMRRKYADMMMSGLSLLEDAGLKPTFGPQQTTKNK